MPGLLKTTCVAKHRWCFIAHSEITLLSFLSIEQLDSILSPRAEDEQRTIHRVLLPAITNIGRECEETLSHFGEDQAQIDACRQGQSQDVAV